MIDPWLGIALVLAIFAALFALFSVIGQLLQPEVLRKGMHISMGVTALSFPWLFESAWPVVLVATAAAAGFMALHAHLPLMRRLAFALERIKRVSVGEFCFVAATAIVFTLSIDDPVLYCIPMLLLTLADSAAALVGTAYGQHRYRSWRGFKTLEGSAAFFTVGFVCIAVVLANFTPALLRDALIVAFLLALAMTAVEAASGRGLDNLLVPVCAWAAIKATGITRGEPAALESGSPIAVAALSLAAALLVLLVVALAWWRRAKLRES